MRIISVAALLLSFGAFAQLPFSIYDTAFFRGHRIRNIAFNMEPLNSGSEYDGLEVFRYEFDRDGKVLFSRGFILYDEVLFSYDTTYVYDKTLLTTKRYFMNGVPRTKEDSALVNEFAHLSRIHFIDLAYDQFNRVVHTIETTDSVNKGGERSTYFYGSSGKLLERVSIDSPLKEYSNRYNERLLFVYDSLGRPESQLMYQVGVCFDLEHKRYPCSPEQESQWTMGFLYDKDRLVKTHRFLKDSSWFFINEYVYSANGILCEEKEVRTNSLHPGGISTTVRKYEWNKEGLLESVLFADENGNELYRLRLNYTCF